MWLDICGVFARMNEHKLHNHGSIPTIKLSTYRPRLNNGKEAVNNYNADIEKGMREFNLIEITA
ncbi:hypothetical protein TSUD_350620 [Trifolium subterraneum]|uniref:Uncharacterized protein n=1 Tax=Trifolium subterraneum TaxID=3900 RepID=A0A2Z6PH63_TRISU|nr:hypothetical protein TSUD_350620 [Trifolium subterraneum]